MLCGDHAIGRAHYQYQDLQGWQPYPLINILTLLHNKLQEVRDIFILKYYFK